MYADNGHLLTMAWWLIFNSLDLYLFYSFSFFFYARLIFIFMRNLAFLLSALGLETAKHFHSYEIFWRSLHLLFNFLPSRDFWSQLQIDITESLKIWGHLTCIIPG